MSKRETPMILRYWEKVGGTLVEEFTAIPRQQDHGTRILDAVIIPDGPKKRVNKSEVEIEGTTTGTSTILYPAGSRRREQQIARLNSASGFGRVRSTA